MMRHWLICLWCLLAFGSAAAQGAPGVGALPSNPFTSNSLLVGSNALKYSPGGGAVRFKVRRDDASMVFEVADQGIGIPSDEIPHLFEPFHRASNVGVIQGTGLGLAIVKSAVETHGGTIEVDSVAGRGTAFTVRLHPV